MQTKILVLALLFFLTKCNSKQGKTIKVSVTPDTNYNTQVYNSIPTNDTNYVQVIFRNGSYAIDSNNKPSNRGLRETIKYLKSTPFNVYKTKKQIPSKILLFLKNQHPDKFLIADPNEEWESSDAKVSSLATASKKLNFIAKWSNFIAISYMQGGVTLSHKIYIIHHKKNEVVGFWFSQIPLEVKDINEIMDYFVTKG